MAYQPIEQLLPKAGNSIYKLVRMAADRAKELADGRRKLIELPNVEKTTTIALEEIREGRIVLKEVQGQFTPPEQGAADGTAPDQSAEPEMSAS